MCLVAVEGIFWFKTYFSCFVFVVQWIDLGYGLSSESNYNYGLCSGNSMQAFAYRLPVALVDFILPVKFATPVVLTQTLMGF